MGVRRDPLALRVEVAVAGPGTRRVPPSGAPVSRRRPIIVSCSRRPTRSQNSTCMRITRTTWKVPPSGVQTSRRISASSWTSGLAVPSRKPNRLRREPPVAVGAIESRRSSSAARTRRAPGAAARAACATTVSRRLAQICSSTSPWQRAGSRSSSAKAGIVVRPVGSARGRSDRRTARRRRRSSRSGGRARSSGRACPSRPAGRRPRRCGRSCPGVRSRARALSASSAVASCAAVERDRVQRGERRLVVARRDHARLVRAVERDARRCSSRRVAREPTAPRRRGPRRRRWRGRSGGRASSQRGDRRRQGRLERARHVRQRLERGAELTEQPLVLGPAQRDGAGQRAVLAPDRASVAFELRQPRVDRLQRVAAPGEERRAACRSPSRVAATPSAVARTPVASAIRSRWTSSRISCARIA